MTLSFAITLVLRYLVVMLFLPFSALDKIVNFNGAVAQARQSIPSDAAARLAIVAALCIEIIMALANGDRRVVSISPSADIDRDAARA
jgi:putative oxidoreductase